jgi:hypothetical protein
MTDPQPCPYHLTAKPDCGHTGNCPLIMIEGYVVCTKLNPKQIVLVRSWVEGVVPE